MALLFFRLKIALKAIASFFRQSPVFAVWTLIIALSVIAAELDTAAHLDAAQCITLLSLFALIALIASLRRYNLTPVLLLYAKSRRTRKAIHLMFFVKKALINNMPIALFGVIIMKGLITVEKPVYVFWFAIFSLSCSLLAMAVKNNYINTRIGGRKAHGRSLSAAFKSMAYDYASHDFFSMRLDSDFTVHRNFHGSDTGGNRAAVRRRLGAHFYGPCGCPVPWFCRNY
jgi:hypothetical protein